MFMKKNIALLSGIALVLLMSGCAIAPNNTAALTFETKPEGATIYEGQTELGVAPVTRTYTYPENTATLETPMVTAVWPSGAKATYWTNLPIHSDLAATINRPASAPGLDKDEANAQKVIDANAKESQRIKEMNAHDLAHDSARCTSEMRTGSTMTSDCF
jgi:hypothetical protein